MRSNNFGEMAIVRGKRHFKERIFFAWKKPGEIRNVAKAVLNHIICIFFSKERVAIATI